MATRRPKTPPVSKKDIKKFRKAERQHFKLQVADVVDRMEDMYLSSDSTINTSSMDSETNYYSKTDTGKAYILITNHIPPSSCFCNF